MIEDRVHADRAASLNANIEYQGDAALEELRHIGKNRIIVALAATVGNDEIQDNGNRDPHEDKYYDNSNERSRALVRQ